MLESDWSAADIIYDSLLLVAPPFVGLYWKSPWLDDLLFGVGAFLLFRFWKQIKLSLIVVGVLIIKTFLLRDIEIQNERNKQKDNLELKLEQTYIEAL